MINASVIIPACNAAPTIFACLQALQQQTVAREQYEIIVVDDASMDETAVLAQTAGVIVLQPGKLGKSGSRNAGAAIAQGDILLFTDADCEPQPDWIAQMLAPFAQDSAVVGVKGAYLSRQTAWVARFTQVEVAERYDLMQRQPTINFIDTYAAAYRRTVFLQNGGFDTTLPEVEDQDFSFRLAAQGHKMVFAPNARVWHHHVTSPRRYFWRKFVIAEWKVVMVHRYPERLFSDSRTPQLLKVQMVLSLLLPVVVFMGAVYRPFFSLFLWWGVAFVLACVPFLWKSTRRDAPILPIILPMLLLRASALACGYLYGHVTLGQKIKTSNALFSLYHRLAHKLTQGVIWLLKIGKNS